MLSAKLFSAVPAALLVVAVSGCGSSSVPGEAPSSAEVSASASASPTQAVTTYRLAGTNLIQVSSLPELLAADTGTLTVNTPSGIAGAVTVVATDKRGQVTWTLSLDVTAQGRIADGSLVAQGTTWRVLPNTGQVSVRRTAESYSLIALRAITMNSGEGPNVADIPNTNEPVVVTLTGTAAG